MHFEGTSCIRRVAQLQASPEAHSATRKPIFPFVSLAQLTLTKMGQGLGVTLSPPAHSTPLHGDRAQPQSELPGSQWVCPQGTRSGSVAPQSPSSSSSLAAAPLPCCGPAAGERAD